MTSTLTPEKIHKIRNVLERHFSAETSLAPETWTGGSDGHCVMASMVLATLFDGKYVSTKLEAVSHWFCRLELNDKTVVDVDLTGDQFGHAAVRIKPAGELYPDSRERAFEEINEQTLRRFMLFINKLNIDELKSL